MTKKNIHITPIGNKWQVKPAGGKATSIHRTQENAINTGRPTARRNEAELVIHRKDGTIRDKDSYGRDPNPPKDTKN